MTCLADRIHEEFSKEFKQMKRYAKAKDINKIAEKRALLHHRANFFAEVSILCSQRNLRLAEMPKVMREFTLNIPEVGLLEEEIELLSNKFKSIDFGDKKSKEQLKQIYSDNFRWILFRKTILGKCKKVGYYEGKLRAESIKGQVDYLASYFRKAHKAWNSLCGDMEELKKAKAYANNEELERLNEYKNSIDTERYSSYSSFLPFSEKVQEYKALVNKFYGAVAERSKRDEIYQKEKARIEKESNEARAKAAYESKARTEAEKKAREIENKAKQEAEKAREEAKKRAEAERRLAEERDRAKAELEKRVEAEKEKKLAEKNSSEATSRYNKLLVEKEEMERGLKEGDNGFFVLDERYVNLRKPKNSEYKTIGRILVSDFCGDVVERFRRADDYFSFLANSASAAGKEDIIYIKHVCDGVRRSLKEGDLGLIIENLNGESMVIYGVLERMERFVESSQRLKECA